MYQNIFIQLSKIRYVFERERQRNLNRFRNFIQIKKISKRDDDDALHGEEREKSNLFLINIASTQKSQKLLPAFIHVIPSIFGEGGLKVFHSSSAFLN